MQQFDCDGLAKTLFDILKLVVDVKMWSHLLGTESYFWFFASPPDGSKGSALLISLLPSLVEASQFPFVRQELYIVLCRCHGAWNRERWKIWLLAQNCSSLVSWRIKVNLEALPYQYQTNRFSPQQKGILWLSALFN